MDVRTLLIGIVIGLLAGWLIEWFIDWRFWRRGGRKETPAEPVEPDDLTQIEGIGPKISGLFQDAGILTFARLAASRPDELSRILREEDERLARLADPTTWPQQASLAAAGAWDALEDLQKELTAGRRA